MIEWHSAGRDIEIRIEPDGTTDGGFVSERMDAIRAPQDDFVKAVAEALQTDDTVFRAMMVLEGTDDIPWTLAKTHAEDVAVVKKLLAALAPNVAAAIKIAGNDGFPLVVVQGPALRALRGEQATS